MRKWPTVARVALADLWAELTLALCSVLALAAVLAPLMVLAGLRAGVVDGLRHALLQNPHAREIVTASNSTYPTATLSALARWQGVAFLVPRTRTLSSSILLDPLNGPSPVRVELLPTASGDPLVPMSVSRNSEIVLSSAAAAHLHANAGDTLNGRLGRIKDGTRQLVSLPLRVLGVAPPASFPRDAAFITVPLAVMIEDFQDGSADMPGDLDSTTAASRTNFAGFRLYADRLEDVPALDQRLRAEGIEVVSRADEVANLTTVDRSLTTLFSVVAGLGGSGFLISLGAGLWANVERKRVELALLRFLGLRSGALRLFPLVQAITVSASGALLGSAAAIGTAVVINSALAGVLAIDQPLCVIGVDLTASACALTMAGAIIVATIAGQRTARVESWEGISTP